ncbi:NADPH:quinone reductase [Pseudaestuariivita atlantica]|uniref:Zinc-binding dehydrogenase n=1 Tax=Pseudaestuariivita atlantica TaxID=1317121 RepID=A0A0L1JT02_9RHOB|nr:NADPH:quinone reductase [Pseudaestuariivita atlantica]KNG94518.1 zinc-binding dehydrogenase [Pseudaestuariivita atlantica]
MKAVWYERFGPADEVLQLGEMETPEPGPGEVRVRVHATGINPSDVKLRGGARPGAVMAHPRVIPHSDGAGIVDAAGPGAEDWIGRRVWISNGQWQRAHGTASEYVCLPVALVAELPDGTSFAEGACLGIPALTAWYALRGVEAGQTVLVTGGAGSVGRYACQMARLMGAEVVTTVSSPEKGAHAGAPWINYRTEDVAARVREMVGGVDRIVEVDFAANQAVSLDVINPGGTIAGYASASVMSPTLDWYGFMFKNVRLHMLIVYQLTRAERAEGQAQVNRWLAEGGLSHAVVDGGRMEDMARAHARVEAGNKLGTVVVTL